MDAALRYFVTSLIVAVAPVIDPLHSGYENLRMREKDSGSMQAAGFHQRIAGIRQWLSLSDVQSLTPAKFDTELGRHEVGLLLSLLLHRYT